MKKIASKAILAGMLVAGTLASVPVPVSAQEVQFYLGDHRRPPPPPIDDDDDGGPPPPYGYHRPPPPPPPGYGYRRPPPPPPGYGCDPQFAARIASANGLRRARVVDVTPRRIIVDGFSRGGPDEMVFANRRGCPIIEE